MKQIKFLLFAFSLIVTLTLGLGGLTAGAATQTGVEREQATNILLWQAGLLPGELKHESTRAQLLAFTSEGLDSNRAFASADLAAYNVATGHNTITLVPASQEQSPSAAQVPHMYGYTIETNDLREIGDPILKNASCYRKADWSGNKMRHDICYWKYRIDEGSGNYDYWLYGNELTASVSKTHRGAPDPFVEYAKVAQQLGSSERSNYMIYGKFDTIKTHAPRGSHYGNCQTIDVTSSISAEAKGASGQVGVSAPLEICSRITEYANFSNSYKRATFVHKDNLWSSNRRKTATIVTQTIIKLKQRPTSTWQPFWSDTAETKVRCWDQWPCRSRVFR